jgi:predicted secreted protein
MRPTPIQAIVILLLGARAPDTEAETTAGTGKAAPATAAPQLFKKQRRVSFLVVVLCVLFVGIAQSYM